MIVRLKLGKGRPVRQAQGKNRHLALACAALLVPAALMAYVMGVWRLASDLGVTGEFAVGGLLSHWQIWIAAGAGLHLAASLLNRYGRGGEFHWPSALSFRVSKPDHADPRSGEPGPPGSLPSGPGPTDSAAKSAQAS